MKSYIQIVIIDSKNNSKWKSPKHSENRKADDFHREVKPIIIKDICRKLIEIYGTNCDIEIHDGLIVLVSKKNTKSSKKRKITNLPAENYFDKIKYKTIISVLNIFQSIQVDILKIQIKTIPNKQVKLRFYYQP